jgi:hypothetical protein
VDTVFDDRPPADAVKVRSALETLRRELSADPGLLGNRDELIRINQAIAGLNDAEAEAFVRALSGDDLRRWNGAPSQQGARVTVVRIHDMPNRGHNASTSPPPPPVERPMKLTSWPAAGTIGRSRWIAAGVAMIVLAVAWEFPRGNTTAGLPHRARPTATRESSASPARTEVSRHGSRCPCR